MTDIQQQRSSLMERLQEIIKDDNPGTWDIAWWVYNSGFHRLRPADKKVGTSGRQEQVTPWEVEVIQPPLRELIESGDIAFPTSGRALVPGCGSGKDVMYFASLGLDSLGTDIAPTAIEIANRNLMSKGESLAAKAKFELVNFFTLKVSEEELFGLVYDYTFFVAIPPSLRPDWGRQMASLVKPGGYLITLVWPIEPETDVGPPFFVRVEHYAKALGVNFVQVLDKEPTTSLPRHVGKERMVVWKRV